MDSNLASIILCLNKFNHDFHNRGDKPTRRHKRLLVSDSAFPRKCPLATTRINFIFHFTEMHGLSGLATTSSEPRSMQLIINSLPDLQKFNSGQKYFVAERSLKFSEENIEAKTKLSHILFLCVCVCVKRN